MNVSIFVHIVLSSLNAHLLSNPNSTLEPLELWALRIGIFLIFLVGLYKVVTDTLKKILK